MLQEKGIMSQDEKSYLLDLFEEVTGRDATQDTYYDLDNTWWLQLSYVLIQELDKLRK